MPELLRLLDQRRHQMRMRMAEHGDGDAAAEIEIALAFGGEEVGPLAPLQCEVVPSIGRQYGWNHGSLLREKLKGRRRTKHGDGISVVVASAPFGAIPSASGRQGQPRAPFLSSKLRRTSPKRREPDTESAGV